MSLPRKNSISRGGPRAGANHRRSLQGMAELRPAVAAISGGRLGAQAAANSFRAGRVRGKRAATQ